MSEQLDLGIHTTEAPNCDLCGRPRRWVKQRQAYARYCGNSHCTSPERICQACQGKFMLHVGDAGTRYCSHACAHNARYARRKVSRPNCIWCGELALNPPRGKAENYVCNPCLEPIKHVIGRLRRHRVSTDLMRALVADPVCQICGADVVTLEVDRGGHYRAKLVVDHDHACCPGETSCGECVRGLVCHNCNVMIGNAKDNPEILEQGAAYLRSARLRAGGAFGSG